MKRPAPLDLRQLLADREAGLSCLQIANKLGTTKGRVSGFLWRHDPAKRETYLAKERQKRRAQGIMPRRPKAEPELVFIDEPVVEVAPEPAAPQPEPERSGRPWNPAIDEKPEWLRRPSQRGR